MKPQKRNKIRYPRKVKKRARKDWSFAVHVICKMLSRSMKRLEKSAIEYSKATDQLVNAIESIPPIHNQKDLTPVTFYPDGKN